MIELTTLVIYDIEDDRARLRVSEACKDYGLERLQFSCFRGILSSNKREELYERLRKIQREWEARWHKDFPEAQVKPMELPVPPEDDAKGHWTPAFKIMIQPLCEKDMKTALYAYLFVDVPKEVEQGETRAGKDG
jgi:hypothetical protein